jgi:hypothetical protein
MRRALIAGVAGACLALGMLPSAFAAGRPCPLHSKNPGGTQACGKDHHSGGGGSQGAGHQGGGNNGGGNHGGTCPLTSKNPLGKPPCGKDHHGGGTGGGASTCGPADKGGTAPPGGVSGTVYGIGKGVSGAGAAPLGDALQTIACSVYSSLHI